MMKVNRRNFIRSSATVASGAAATTVGATKAASVWSKTRGVSPNDKIHVALIGCGGMGRYDLSEFLRLDQAECVALADVDDAQVQEGVKGVEESRNHRPDTYRDFRRILDRDDIDVVIVGTPDHWHALPTIMACQAGKDVYVEKPLATSIEEGRAMVDAARKYDRVVQVGTQFRSAEHMQEAVKIVRSGQLGNIRKVRTWAYHDSLGPLGNPPDADPPDTVDYDFWLGPAPKRPFNPMRFHIKYRWFWDYSGGATTDYGAHVVDVAAWAMGEEPIGASGFGGNFGYPDDMMETFDSQVSTVQFPSFTLLWEHQLGNGVGPWQHQLGIEFHGNSGILVVNPYGWEVRSETNTRRRTPREYRMKGIPWRDGPKDYHFDHVRNFVECLESRDKPNADIEVHHKTVNICHLANIATRLESAVSWDPATEKIGGDPRARAMLGRKYRAPWKLPRV